MAAPDDAVKLAYENVVEVDADEDAPSEEPVPNTVQTGTEDSFEQIALPSEMDLPPLPDDDTGLFDTLSDSAETPARGEESALMEKEMKQKLMDIESSFLPEPSMIAPVAGPPPGADDTYLFAGSPAYRRARTGATFPSDSEPSSDTKGHIEPETPAEAYKTPAADRHELAQSEEDTSTAAPSSPAAAAARRTQSRTAATAGESGDNGDAANDHSGGTRRPSSKASTVRAPEASQNGDDPTTMPQAPSFPEAPPSGDGQLHVRKRPSHLNDRTSSQRSSTSSFAIRSDTSVDVPSEDTVGADFALQSGGAASTRGDRQSSGLSRLPSFGSIASAVSGYSDFPDRNRAVSGALASSGLHGDSNLEPLDEEGKGNARSGPVTPRPRNPPMLAPTDTVIAQHVQNIRVPDTVAREYREKHSRSPEKRGTLSTPYPTKTKGNLTLKEQNSKIDKLSKENFDLKLKIHFLDQALQNRSDEGVKDMISKNVALQTDLANEKKENQALRRKLRDLERRLKLREDGDGAAARGFDEGDDQSRFAEMEEEITYLRECLQQSESETERLRGENVSKEADKRRLAEFVKSMGDRKASGTAYSGEEEGDMWKELLEAETARREHADDEISQLRGEIQRLRSATPSSANNYTRKTSANLRKSVQTRSQASDEASEYNGTTTASTLTTLVDQLKHENAELRRDLGAQTSMLTSRNRERERLQQQIEDLKLLSRRGDGTRSVAGDSIFDRSISRAHQRPTSRASANTRVSQLSDNERDEFERRHNELRDEVAQLKLLNQDLERELNAHLDLLTQAENELGELKEERDLTMEDLQALQAERDEALTSLQEKEEEIEGLKEEALSSIDQLETDIEQKEIELDRINTELENRNEDFEALQEEMKTVSASLIQLEDDREVSERRILGLEQDVQEAHGELESLDKRISDLSNKNERLEVQVESYQNEISFLREEQEGDKIKIGELEAAVAAAKTSLQDERDKVKEVEERMSRERKQRDIVGNQEKEEVQKAMQDLNQQAAQAKDETRRLRKSLSSKEVEATTWKQRLDELENDLRKALGDLNGTRSTLLKDVTKLQRDLDSTLRDLQETRDNLKEKERLLRNRDTLLENTGMESKRLSEMLEKERQGRRQDRQLYEQSQRSHQNVTRSVQQHESRVLELETQKSQDRRKIAHLEQQYREQLFERNNLLLAIWNRLSTLCGTDWSQRNSLVSGENPSVEVIGRHLPGFTKNVTLALTTVETIVGRFRSQVRDVEKELWRNYQNLEHNLDVRSKRLEQLEKAVLSGRRSSRPSSGVPPVDSTELVRLRGENRNLRAELQKQPSGPAPSLAPRSPKDSKRASSAASLLRHHSNNVGEAGQLSTAVTDSSQQRPAAVPTMSLNPKDKTWMLRIKALEKQLIAEREARNLDRSGARQRILQSRAETEELRLLYERQQELRDIELPTAADPNGNQHAGDDETF